MSYHLGVQGIFLLKAGSLMANQETTSDSDLKEEIRTEQNLAREMERERKSDYKEWVIIDKAQDINSKKQNKTRKKKYQHLLANSLPLIKLASFILYLFQGSKFVAKGANNECVGFWLAFYVLNSWTFLAFIVRLN